VHRVARDGAGLEHEQHPPREVGVGPARAAPLRAEGARERAEVGFDGPLGAFGEERPVVVAATRQLGAAP
jgi:hypothetical protein